jgi:hypothetical protein
MGTVTDFRAFRQRPGTSGRFVTCAHCGERHPIIRLAGGSVRCVTAFAAEDRWFCRNRGCRAAWLQRRARQED